MNPRRLYRCRHDRMLAGVASGMAEYLQVDPTVVRIVWLLSTFLGGLTILLYIILAFVIPLEPVGEPGTAAGTEPGGDPGGDPGAATATYWHNPPVERQPGRLGMYAGIGLVVLGGIALVDVIVPSLVVGPLVGPAVLLALGIALVVGSARRQAPGQ